MRFVAIAVILASIPLLISLLRRSPHLRPLALAAVGLLLFLGDTVRVAGMLYGWPNWEGLARGIDLSPADAFSIALILTRRKIPRPYPFLGVLGFYAAMLLISVVLSSVPTASLFLVSRFASVLLLFVALTGEFHHEASRRALLSGVAVGLIVQAAYVAVQKGTGAVQATGLMYHQNVLGMMAELGLFLLLSSLLAGDRRKIVVMGALAGLVIVAGGGSRAAMAFAAGGAVILVLLSLIRGVTPAKLRVLGVGVLGMAIAVPVGVVTLKDRFGERSVLTQEEQRERFKNAARAISADYPFGIGANNYVSFSNTRGYAERAGVAWNRYNRAAPVHNAYLLARAETGWLGEFALILMLAWPAMRGFQLAFRNRRGPAGELALGSALAITAVAIHNNFEFQFFSYNVLGLVMVNLATVAAVLRGSRITTKQRQPRGPGMPREAGLVRA